MTVTTSSDYLTPEQVTELIPGITKQYLAQLRYTGRGPKFLKPSPRVVVYRRVDCIEWLESSERTITGRDAA